MVLCLPSSSSLCIGIDLRNATGKQSIRWMLPVNIFCWMLSRCLNATNTRLFWSVLRSVITTGTNQLLVECHNIAYKHEAIVIVWQLKSYRELFAPRDTRKGYLQLDRPSISTLWFSHCPCSEYKGQTHSSATKWTTSQIRKSKDVDWFEQQCLPNLHKVSFWPLWMGHSAF